MGPEFGPARLTLLEYLMSPPFCGWRIAAHFHQGV